MKLLPSFFGNNQPLVKEITNVDKGQPQRDRIINRIVRRQLIRTRQEIDKWRLGLDIAENEFRPTRIELVRTYKDITLDAHLTSLMETRILKVLGHEFWICDDDGENIPEQTELLKSEWFAKFVRLAMESKFYGHSLIQFGAIKDDEFTSIELVPREYVIPERHGVMRNLYVTNDLIDYTQPPFNAWSIAVGESRDFGLLNKAVPHAIWKKNANASWAEFAEVFGQPMRIGKTSTDNKENRENLESMLDNMGSSSWAVTDTEDEITLVENTKSDAHMVFDAQIDRANSEMSKLFAGQTMTTDDGSSRSQSEVHERVADAIFKSDIAWMTNLVNHSVIPLMQRHRIPITGRFKYPMDEKLDKTSQFAIDKELLTFYKVEPSYFSDKYGIPVEEKEQTMNQNVENAQFQNAIDKFYGKD